MKPNTTRYAAWKRWDDRETRKAQERAGQLPLFPLRPCIQHHADFEEVEVYDVIDGEMVRVEVLPPPPVPRVEIRSSLLCSTEDA